MSKQTSPACRSCGATGLISILDLGRTPLANALLTAEQLTQPEEVFPLDLVFCSTCSLVQITESVSPEKLFREYLYFSSVSDTVLRHAEALAGRLIAARHLTAGSLVVEIASNDGYLLQYYKRAGIPVLGIEPATNIARVAREERGIPSIEEFFDEALAGRLLTEYGQADVIHAHNVLAHVKEVNNALRGIQLLLKDDGVAVIEVPYVKEMIDRCEFDTIYHEHLCYFSLTALSRLFERNGLFISDVEELAIHGGTLRVYGQKRSDAGSPAEPSPAVIALLKKEADWGVGDSNFYLGFGARIQSLREELLKLLQSLKREGNRIAVYGASAKGSTLLNFFGIDHDLIDYVVDRSPFKQGYYTPGTHFQIYPVEKLLDDRPDYVLLLVWNFYDEILAQQAEYRGQGGKFIVPIPEVKVV